MFNVVLRCYSNATGKQQKMFKRLYFIGIRSFQNVSYLRKRNIEIIDFIYGLFIFDIKKLMLYNKNIDERY